VTALVGRGRPIPDSVFRFVKADFARGARRGRAAANIP
jgi:hypothetical protein